MAHEYQLVAPPGSGVIRNEDSAHIPDDTKNRDWKKYQRWVAQGHTPDPAPTATPPIIISAIDFMNRFTDEEKVAVLATCTASPAIGVGLIQGLATGWITLDSGVVSAWMDSLVNAEAITGPRKIEILTP